MIFFISQKADKPGFLLYPLCLTFSTISQKVLITEKWFSYHLKSDIKTFPTSSVTLLYDNYQTHSDQKCILVVFFWSTLYLSVCLSILCICLSVSDPLFFFTDPDPTQKSKADPDPDPDPSKSTSNCVKKQKEKKCAYFALRT